MFALTHPILLVLLLLISGCARHPREPALPTYSWVNEPTALATLAARANAVRTVQAQAGLTLTRPDGESVQLDGAVAMAPPDRARLRAWKFNQPVFDLTLTPQGVWLMTPQDPSRRERVLPATRGAAEFVRHLGWLTGSFFTEPDLLVQSPPGRPLIVSKVVDPQGSVLRAAVDRETLTPRQYTLLDPQGQARFTLRLDQYRDFGAAVWPTRLRAVSETGTIDVRLRDVELNVELAPRAFVPPRRAERISD